MDAATRLKTPKPSINSHPPLRSTPLILAAVALLLWASRLAALDLLPLHNDEGLHLTRAVEVWNGHPFWEIRDGKIINHWAIALFQPQHAPVFAGRIATVFIALIGFAAAFTLAKRAAGLNAALLVSAIWISSHYLFFYERLAFSDAEAGALVILACLGGLRIADTSHRQTALLTGIALSAAVLFKFTAAPFALSILILILFSRGTAPLRQRLIALVIVASIGAFSLAVPTLYLLRRGEDVFSIALGWISTGSTASGGSGIALLDNLARLGDLMWGFSGIRLDLALIVTGLISALLLPRLRVMFLAWIVPALVILLLGREVLPRHYVVGLPLALTIAGIGLAAIIDRFRLSENRKTFLTAGISAALLLGFLFQSQSAYRSPTDQIMPEIVRREHITEHSGGFGLADAAAALPTLIEPGSPIIASMFPDSCRRANFYAQGDLTLTCTDAPGTDLIRAALETHGWVYVLTDTSPLIGADMNALSDEWNVRVERTAGFPRPGEDEASASVVLWRVTR